MTRLVAAVAFCRDVLGLDVIGKQACRHIFFRVGNGVLLAFVAKATFEGDMLPPHGARGPGHFALGMRAENLDEWKRGLEAGGVVVEQEVGWPRGGRSLYLRDPAGNSVELVTPGLWGLRSGW